MLIKSIKLNIKILFLFFSIAIVFPLLFILLSNANTKEELAASSTIKWVDFKVTAKAMVATSKLDIDSHLNDYNIKFNWIELLSILACRNGGDFSSFKQYDLDSLVDEITSANTIEQISSSLKLYNYYHEAYTAVLGEFLGYYYTSDDTSTLTKTYGIKVFSPIAKNFHFTHYDDFGASRSYGFDRTHLGNDLMGSIGTPIIAIESGIVENLGWNQYGGWRIGIRSFDQQRYYYYAHLRKDHPYVLTLEEGSIVTAGDVIGYLGMTGYSTTENVNNVNIPHLHLGLELIFDTTIVDSPNEIWIDVYEIVEFLQSYQSEVIAEENEYVKKSIMIEDFLMD